MSDKCICIYDRVTLHNGMTGEVQFMGKIEGKEGVFYGVKLDAQQGKNNGTHQNIKYFECSDKYGVFVTAQKIKNSEPTQFNSVLPRISIDERVFVKTASQHGSVQFVGIVEFDNGCWYGIELDEPLGENNGSVDDRQYFECMDYYGVFTQSNDIQTTEAQKKALLSDKKPNIKSSSDISGIKSYKSQEQKAIASAPPPPLQAPSKSQNSQQNLLTQDIESMGFIQLKARCGMEGLSTFGTKKQLLSRLRQRLYPNQKQESTPSTTNTQSIASPKHKPQPMPSPEHKPQPMPSPKHKPQPIASPKQKPQQPLPHPHKQRSLDSFDPELHDLDPEKDDFYQPITKANTLQEEEDFNDARQGSVIYHTKDKEAKTNGMEPLQEEEEPNDPLTQQPGGIGQHTQPLQSQQAQQQLTTSKSEENVENKNDDKDTKQEAIDAQDWIMLPDPNSGKMYYANLKTKETRWQPPPGFGVTKAIQNPTFNPGLVFQNPGAQIANQYQQHRPNPVWQSFSTTNFNAQNPAGSNPNGAHLGSGGILGRQVSPFSSATNMQQQYVQQSPANTFQQNPQWAQSAFHAGAQSNLNLNQYQNPGVPKAKSTTSMLSTGSNKSLHKSGSLHKSASLHKSKKSMDKSRRSKKEKDDADIDPMTKLEASKWKKTKDPSTGREYWYHRDTKQTTWDPPPAVKRLEAANAVSGISSIEDIDKPVWDNDSEASDYSTSGSYYDDGDTDDEEEEDTDSKKHKQPQKQYATAAAAAPQQFANNPGMNGYNQGAQGWNQGHQGPPNGFAQGQQGQPQQYGSYQQGSFNPAGNANFAAYNNAQATYNNNQYSAPKQDSARQMYLKPTTEKGKQQQHRDEKQAEDNPWISAEEAKSRVIVRDTLKRYWQIGAEQSFKLNGWAKMHYQMTSHKKGLFGKKQQTIADVLSYTEFKQLKCPLNRAAASDEKLKEQCMQTWKNINSYMGIRKSGKSSEGHVEKLVRFALKGDDKLRNEIYCQLAKQTTKNPKLTSLLKGWKLLLICCSFFPPSDQFVDYLACFIWNNTQQPNEIGQYAIKALHALDATMLSSSRKFPPLPLEIVKLENLQPIPLNIYFINGMKCKQVLVTSQTRAKQVIETLAQTFNFAHPEAFGLYEMEPNIPPLDKMKKHYIKRELMSQQEKINDLIRMPFERELECDDRMLDVIASWLKRDQSKRRKGGESKNKSKKKHHKSSKNVRFVLKVKTFRKPMEKGFSHMGAKANFLTHVWHVVNDFYPIGSDDEEFAFELAALQLQGTWGPNPKLAPTATQNKSNSFDKSQTNVQGAFYKQGVITYDLHKYLGQNILKKYLPGDRNACEQKILQCRANKYSAMQRHDCWLRYAKMLRSSKKMYNYFGCAWYRGVRIQGDNGTDKKTKSSLNKTKSSLNNNKDRNTNDLLVGINEHAITFVNPITQHVVERYEMEEILTFGYRSNAFLFVAGTLMTQSKMQIATMHGKAMNRLVRTHIDLRVRDAEKKGQKIKNVPKTNDI